MDVGGRNLDLLNSDQNGQWIQQIESEVDVGESTITSDNREVFIALASLIRAGRHEMALAILATYSILVFRPFAVHTGSTV